MQYLRHIAIEIEIDDEACVSDVRPIVVNITPSASATPMLHSRAVVIQLSAAHFTKWHFEDRPILCANRVIRPRRDECQTTTSVSAHRLRYRHRGAVYRRLDICSVPRNTPHSVRGCRRGITVGAEISPVLISSTALAMKARMKMKPENIGLKADAH